jgi:hypothetical protein
LPQLSVKPVTGSAFTQARYKIKPSLFKDLCKLPFQVYNNDQQKKRWKSHVLLAGDGSTLNLPLSDDIKEEFGIYTTTDTGVDRCICRILFFQDVLNEYVVDGRLSIMSTGEMTLLTASLKAIEHLEGLCLLNRNFGNFSTIKELTTYSREYCVRMSTSVTRFAKSVMSDPRKDFIIDWKPSVKEKSTCIKNKLDHHPLKVRVVKIVLDTGETELLVTSLLDQEEYSTQELSELYHLRWGGEEYFKDLKTKMKIEYFGCKKSQGIYQEFYAHIFCLNMVSLVGRLAEEKIEQQTKNRKHSYKYNWKNAYRFWRDKMVNFLNLEEIEKILKLLISQIASSVVAIKPNRKYKRDPRLKDKVGRITHYNK